MPKKKTRNKPKIKRSKWRKFVPWTLLASALLVGAFVIPNNLLNQKETAPKIDSITPATGTPFALLTIHGSGFTTQQEYDTRIKGGGLPAGNYLRIAGRGTMGPPSFSPDGKTLKFQLALSSADAPNCELGETGIQCQISLQVVNGKGVPSNIYHFQLYRLEHPLVMYMSLDSQNPPAQNITPGATDVEVLQFKVKAANDNPVNVDITDFIVKTVPTYTTDWGIYCKDLLSNIKIIDASTGELFGSYSSFPDNLVQCLSTISTWLPLSPGEEKMFSIKLSVPSQAKAGVQFNVALEKTFPGAEYTIPGGNVVTSNLITITP